MAHSSSKVLLSNDTQVQTYETYAQVYDNLLCKCRGNQQTLVDIKSVENHFKKKSIVVTQALAYGPNSVVFLGKQTSSGRILALKIINKRCIENLGGNLIKRSVDYHKVHKSNKIAIVHEFASINESYMSLVFDYYAGGSLALLLRKNGPIQENVAQDIFKMVLQGLCYLHICKIAHRNLKLENILLDEQNIPVVADFSASIIAENNSNWEYLIATSLPYLAPEVMSNIPYDPIIADIWSFGICLFSTLNDCLPFGSSGKPKKLNYTLKFNSQLKKSLSESVQKCLNDSLQFDVNKRATSFSLQAEQWFNK